MRTDKAYYIKAFKRAERARKIGDAIKTIKPTFASMLFVLLVIGGCISNENKQMNADRHSSHMIYFHQCPDGLWRTDGGTLASEWNPFSR